MHVFVFCSIFRCLHLCVKDEFRNLAGTARILQTRPYELGPHDHVFVAGCSKLCQVCWAAINTLAGKPCCCVWLPTRDREGDSVSRHCMQLWFETSECEEIRGNKCRKAKTQCCPCYKRLWLESVGAGGGETHERRLLPRIMSRTLCDFCR